MKVFGISNCDTVRKARKYLQAHDCGFEFIDFRKDGLNIVTVQEWLQYVDLSQIVNKRSTPWRGLDEQQKTLLTAESASDAAMELLIAEPTLIKRPVLQTKDAVILGFKEAEYKQFV